MANNSFEVFLVPSSNERSNCSVTGVVLNRWISSRDQVLIGVILSTSQARRIPRGELGGFGRIETHEARLGGEGDASTAEVRVTKKHHHHSNKHTPPQHALQPTRPAGQPNDPQHSTPRLVGSE